MQIITDTAAAPAEAGLAALPQYSTTTTATGESGRAAPRTWVEIDTAAWEANYRAIARAVQPLELMPVIKANAYGLGDQATARALQAAGARYVAVSCLSEGRGLLDFGMGIVLLGGSLPDEVAEIVATGLIPSVSDLASAAAFSAEAGRQGRRVRVHIKIDTGMGRFGVPLAGARELVRQIAALPGLELHGIFSHFAASRNVDRQTMAQVTGFAELIAALAADGVQFEYRHIANSTAIGRIPAACRDPFNMVRSGIDLHGGQLSFSPRPYETRPVLTLKARLLAARTMPLGSTIGYGRTYTVTAAGGERIGVVSIGYADGYPRCLTNRGTMLVRGVRCKVRGIVCMDYTMVSLADAADAAVGDEVVVIGRQGNERVEISEVAQAAQTIPYELMCGLGSRVVRRYL